MMELRHLRYFVALAEELHFTRAAGRLGISQPPLSQQIRQLEALLGTPLFQRTNRRVALTEAGRTMLDEARATLAQAARTETVARRAARGEVGELRIGLFPSAPLLPAFRDAVLAFRRRMPDVHLTLEEGPTMAQIELLRHGRLDAGFLRCPSAADLPPDLATLELSRERLIVVMRRDHPLACKPAPLRLEELAEEAMVFFARSVGTTLHAQLDALCGRAGFAPRIVQETRENSTLMGLVGAGFGIAVVPSSLARIRVAEVVRRELDTPVATTSTWLATPIDSPTALASAFLACAIMGRDVTLTALLRRSA